MTTTFADAGLLDDDAARSVEDVLAETLATPALMAAPMEAPIASAGWRVAGHCGGARLGSERGDRAAGESWSNCSKRNTVRAVRAHADLGLGRCKLGLTSPEAISCRARNAPYVVTPCVDRPGDRHDQSVELPTLRLRVQSDAGRQSARLLPAVRRPWPCRALPERCRRGAVPSVRPRLRQLSASAPAGRATCSEQAAPMTDGHARKLALDGVGSSEQQLHSCSSCDRITRQRSDVGATCEFCGGVLRHMWGLGQLAAHRAGRETEPLEALAGSTAAERLG
jgi:hypothetical protein